MKCLVEGDGERFLQVVVGTARLEGADPISGEIMKICRGYSMECLSLRPKFREEDARSGQIGRWEGDGHWNELGIGGWPKPYIPAFDNWGGWITSRPG